MEPSIASENVHVLNKIIYKWNEPKRFDLIVFEKDHHIYVKRIIGLPGERIEYRENQLYINGGEFSENFLTTWTNDFHLEEVTFQKRVPDNSYFVLGDNRSHSMDSRILGFIKKDQIKGKLLPMLRVTF